MGRISNWQLIKRETQPSLTVRSTVLLKDLQNEMDEARNKVFAYLKLIDEYPAGAFYAVYYSFSKKEVDLEAGFPVYRKMGGEEEIQPAEKSAGLFLSCYHQGPYRKIPSVYKEMDQWLEEHSFETSGISEENYLNENVDENFFLTQILIPVQEKNKDVKV